MVTVTKMAPIRILQPFNYPITFNSPRRGENTVIRSYFWPLKKISPPLEAVLIPFPPFQKYDLIHSFNRIIFGSTPYIISFEGELPRTIGDRSGRVNRILRNHLLKENCHRIIAISHYAKRVFQRQQAGWDHLDQALGKLTVFHPNVEIGQDARTSPLPGKTHLDLAFVGHHFARKGGITALRFAKAAEKAGLPVKLHIVSQMKYAGKIYTDSPRRKNYENDLKALAQDNIVSYGVLPYRQVIALLARSDFLLLPTVHDTFGYSILDGFSVGTPAIGTDVCAVPEMIDDGRNGYLLDVDKDGMGNWVHLGKRNDPDYWGMLDCLYSDTARQLLQRVERVLQDRAELERLRRGALETVRQRFSAEGAKAFYERLYAEAFGRAVSHHRESKGIPTGGCL